MKVPKYKENESSFELEEMINPIASRDKAVFHTRNKPDYSPLMDDKSNDKFKNEQ